MSSETIEVKKRDGVGTLAARRIRRDGRVPAILYGHGEENVNLTVNAAALGRLIHHGAKLLSLTGDVTDTALLRDVQWDSFGIDVLHIDLTRVSRSETVEVTIPIELHGEAPGVSQGGLLSFASHQLTILCPAANIPEHMQVIISELNIGDAIHANEVTLPEGASLVTNASEVVVQVNKPAGGAAGDDETSDVEPELIRKEKTDEEKGEES